MVKLPQDSFLRNQLSASLNSFSFLLKSVTTFGEKGPQATVTLFRAAF